ncbi:PEBP-like protein [Sporormia fimetaria CBS 119925]|uniref:PEBP-like protein n=1 Tax=Sporormia fimetaria CBS 119925 TaxID=1340428 RepID=A0A6A6VMT7_9PLEO|nr:PEBP-like protein [Sporormia fimetaria CBS 119925]
MMVSTKLALAVAALQSIVNAQAAPGFPFQVEEGQTLEIVYGENYVEPAGELMPRADLLEAPTISAPGLTTTGTGILLMVDSDVPRNGTRVELLHWLASGVTLSSDSPLTIPEGEAPYRPPNPPVGDTPHAYTFILFEQPDDFSVPEEFTDVLESRVFFNTSAFVQAAGLQQPALAANYLQVQNLTGTPTTTFPPPRATATNGTGAGGGNGTETPAGTPEPFPGVAAGLDRGVWMGAGIAVVAGVLAIGL